MTTEQAADVLGCTSRWIRKLIATNRLPATREGRAWSLNGADVNDYMTNRRQT
jgi:excisionase family DNA binding protein